MKNINKFLSLLIIIALAFSACKKVDPLPFYANGSPVTLTASKTTVALSVADSATSVVTFSWSDPNYSVDSAHQKFIVEIDSSGRNFTHKVTYQVDGPFTFSLTGKQLNDVLANFGFTAGQPFNVDVRLTSSYTNNNEQYKSNVVTIAMTPYLVPIKLTPSSAGPLKLDISNATSNAVSFTWNASSYGNNVIYYALQLDTAGHNFASPQVFKYGTALNAALVQNDLNTAAINAGVIGGSTKNVEFRIVSYKGTDYTSPLAYSNAVTINLTTYVPVPDNLYIVGDATPGGWANPVPLPSQQFTKSGTYSFSITLGLTSGKSYLFLPLNGNWDHKYGGASATGGTLLKDGDVPGSNTPAPAASGVYRIVVNFQTNTYTVTQVPVPANLYIVGDATPGEWSNPVALPSQQFTRIDAASFGIILNLTAGKSYLFLPVNGDWSHKYGGASATGGTLLSDNDVPGSNTPAPATSGLYKIIVDFQTNSYTVTPYTGPDLPANLYIVGDATPGQWNNPVPVPSQQFTRVSNAEYKLVVPLSAGKSYLFLPLNGNWDHKFGGSTDATNGGTPLLVDNAVPSSNTPAPAASGNYLVDVNFITMSFNVTPQ